MAKKNKMKGVVEIELGDANRLLKFDMNAIAELEAFFDRPSHKIFDQKRGVGIREIRGTLWVGLQRFHPGVKIEEVGDWLDEVMEEKRFNEVSEAVGTALMNALGALSEDESKNAEPPVKGAKPKSSTSRRSLPKPDVSE